MASEGTSDGQITVYGALAERVNLEFLCLISGSFSF
jgi:hypothetical protein